MPDSCNSDRSQCKIGLGCAQLGTQYGIANTLGPPSADECELLLNNCFDSGLRLLDTAHAYPGSEQAIGDCLQKAGQPDWFIVTKWIFDQEHSSLWAESMTRLGRKPNAVLAHRTEQLFDTPENLEWLLQLKDTGQIQKWGCSLYQLDDLERLMQIAIPDIVQLPINIFDQRAISTGLLNICQENGIEVHVRSLFLQGLVFLRRDQFSKRFPKHTNLFDTACEIAKSADCDLSELGLRWLAHDPRVTTVVLGAERWTQIQMNLQAAESPLPIDVREKLPLLASTDESLINPSKWN